MFDQVDVLDRLAQVLVFWSGQPSEELQVDDPEAGASCGRSVAVESGIPKRIASFPEERERGSKETLAEVRADLSAVRCGCFRPKKMHVRVSDKLQLMLGAALKQRDGLKEASLWLADIGWQRLILCVLHRTWWYSSVHMPKRMHELALVPNCKSL